MLYTALRLCHYPQPTCPSHHVIKTPNICIVSCGLGYSMLPPAPLHSFCHTHSLYTLLHSLCHTHPFYTASATLAPSTQLLPHPLAAWVRHVSATTATATPSLILLQSTPPNTPNSTNHTSSVLVSWPASPLVSDCSVAWRGSLHVRYSK